ncbi:MAG: Flp pilus assembly complex ATPase component TadA [Cloacibacillus porcorum]|uniref:GspE/PulE family protein n=1 Tax=Cloacibacillus porcorum TaxID=1197717 RepID=UPI0023EF8F0B|nr:type II/IV secretion system protein [Cloacibacillus porcorum]MCD7875914.1 Flp pilus assembly complex ATPase component TadA [Cloacibacillus porcorum]
MARQQIKVIRLGELLLNAGVISQENLNAALAEQKVSHLRLGEILIKEGYLTENHLAEALCTQLDLEAVSLVKMRPQQEALSLVPENVATRLNLLPLQLIGDDRIVVAMADVMKQEQAVQSAPNIVTVSQTTAQDVTNIAADAAPVVRLVNSILEQAVREKASDIHIEPTESMTRVRLRIDGTLFSNIEIPSNLHLPLIARIKILSGMDIAEKRRPQDGRILIKVAGSRIDLRVSTLPSILGEKVVLRLLDQSNDRIGMEKLGFGDTQRELLHEAIMASNGIVLATGPTGSGKSTTLYSLLEILNDPSKNIITLEDPVEFTIAGLTQIQINERIGLTFGSALRSILRQDPDIIMVGEIRDTETAQLAVRVALTGHLVLSTLHTNDAPTAVNRLVDMGVPRFLLASSLRAVLAQRLVRSLCPHCKEKLFVNAAMEAETGIPAGTMVYGPKGCPECRFTGYKGRTVIAEIMPVDNTLRAMINDGASEQELRDYSRRFGMITLREDARRKVEEGITSIDEMLFTTIID